MKHKKALRQLIRDKRQAYSSKEQLLASQNLCEKLSTDEHVSKAKSIAIYLSNDGELNPLLFIEWCWKNNKHTYLPVLHPFSKGQLLFLRYSEKTILQPNKYGIMEPQLNVQDVITLPELDIIFTPLVAFDKSGQRLGMGGGFYDRTLQTWHNEKALKKKSLTFTPIGLAHDFQEVKKLTQEIWDIPLPKIITPTKTLICYTC